MIRTVIQISALRLWHNKAELLLTFVVPIIFFSIFAWIFGGRGMTKDVPKTNLVICDEVHDEASQRIVSAICESDVLQVRKLKHSETAESTPTVSRDLARQLVKQGMVAAAVVLKPNVATESQPDGQPSNGVGRALPSSMAIEVLTDSFDQVASKVVAPAVQKAVVTAMTPKPSFVQTQASGVMPAGGAALPNGLPVSAPTPMLAATVAIPEVSVRDVLGEGKTNPVVAMYAAGIAVMFLLFSAVTSSGSLLEERENSTLERLLSSRMTMDHLLLGKWCYLMIIGCAQTTLMFVSGAVFFKLQLREHWDGFVIMTIVTAAAASSFALMLAALCKTRAQLGWVSTVLILSMSALGGSMVPRYLMSDQIKRVGQFTFNAWALDGYNKVFWRELPISELTREVSVLGACALLFLIVARIAAVRWDRS